MHSVTLVIPGLLPVPEAAALPAESRLWYALARADRFSTPSDYLHLLTGEFGLKLPPGEDWPAAAFSYLEDTGQPLQSVCMRIDPVHVAPGREGLVLLDSSLFEITGEEATELAAAIQPLLADYTSTIEIPDPSRWYMQMQAVPDLHTTPLYDVAGRDVGPYLPRGHARRDWLRLLNEIQMVLHEQPINHARESRGVLTINSVWFWGAGALPVIESGRIDVVTADELVARGLARACGMALQSLPAGAEELLQACDADQTGLIVIDSGWRFSQYNDAAGWMGFVDWLDSHWILPLVNALRHGELQSLTILTPGEGYHLKRRHLWRFWRRPTKLKVKSDQ